MMKNKILLLVLALSFCIPFAFNTKVYAEIPTSVRVIYSTVNVYSQPNVAEDSTVVVAQFKYNDKLTTNGTDLVLGDDGLQYYKVVVTGVDGFEFGYVLQSQVVDSSIVSPQKRLDANGVTNQESKIYILNGNNYEETEDVLAVGTKIKILSGYNTQNEFTQIQYQNQDGDIVTAYIKTNTIKTSGISGTLIGVIIIVVTIISLVLIIFGIGGKRKKKNKK